ncbi:hypothetical protein ABI59_02930 [Acidobacteria bacterium Mor1]|nr:hypothetical protein ABI59_02930 [Acidobacteria bacterium Mor1]
MIKDIVVEVERRSETGKNACRRMRAQGMVPGVVYGLDSDPFPVAVSPRRISQVLREETGRNTIFKLQLADDTAQQRSVMLKELQRDPITEDLLHVDFVRLDLSQSIQVQVPIELVGTPVGVQLEGGILDFIHRSVLIECLPSDIPENVPVDVSGLHNNQNVSVGDLQESDKFKVMETSDTIIAVVSAPKEEAVEETEGEEGAEAADAPEAEAKEGGESS